MGGAVMLLVAVAAMAAANFLTAAYVLDPGSPPPPPMCDEPDAEILILGAGFSGVAAAQKLSDNCKTDFLILEQYFKPGGRVRSELFNGYSVELGAQWILNAYHDDPSVRTNPIYNLALDCDLTGIVPFTANTVAYDNEGNDVTAEYFQELSTLVALQLDLIQPGSIVDTLATQRDFTAEQGLRFTGGWRPLTPEAEAAESQLIEIFAASPSDTTSFNRFVLYRRAAVTLGTTTLLVTDQQGFDSLATCALNEFLGENDPRIRYYTLVQKIRWSNSCVCVDTINLATPSETKTYCAPYAIVTFGLAVLKDPYIFYPPLPGREKVWPIFSQTMSNFLKIWVLFNESFWDPSDEVDWIVNVDRINGREYYPRFVPYGDFLPGQPPILQALLTGSFAGVVARQDREITKQQIYEIMRRIYGDNATYPLDLIQHCFITDSLFQGDFSYPNPGTNDTTYDLLEAPLGRLFFAGEHTQRLYRGTVHGAWFSGWRAAQQVLEEINDKAGLQIFCQHDSPVASLDGGTGSVSIYVATNRPPEEIQCRLFGDNGEVTGSPVDCTAGVASWSGLTPGECYTIRLHAIDEDDERTRERKEVCIPADDDSCSAHLVNCGTTIEAGVVTIQFGGVGAEDYECTLDGDPYDPCESPLVLSGLEPGRHRVVVRPICSGDQEQLRVSFTIE